MIIQEFVTISLNSNQTFDSIKYWTDKGYPNLRPQQKLEVRVSELPKFSGAKVMFKCDECGVEWERRYSKKFLKGNLYKEDLCYSCSRKKVAKENNCKHTNNKGWYKSGGEHHNFNPNKKAFNEYAYRVRRITEETYAKHSREINPNCLPRTLCGVEGGYQLDHRISIHKGFKFGINPKVIGSLDNLQMLSWESNRNKHK